MQEQTRFRRAHLPSTLGFSPIDDRTRLPGRFFYRLIVGRGLGAAGA